MKATKTRKRLLIALLAIIVLVTGCYTARGPLLMWAYGIHQPRVENKGSLLAASKRFGLDTQHLVTVEPATYRQLLSRFYHSIPEAIIFNKEGQFINYKAQQSDCNAGLFSFISRLDERKSYPIGDSITLKETIRCLRDLDGKPLPATYIDNDADFYVMISWAAYSGKLNSNHVSVWQKLAGQNSRAKIQVIEVNFDVQSWWPAQAKDTMLRKVNI